MLRLNYSARIFCEALCWQDTPTSPLATNASVRTASGNSTPPMARLLQTKNVPRRQARFSQQSRRSGLTETPDFISRERDLLRDAKCAKRPSEPSILRCVRSIIIIKNPQIGQTFMRFMASKYPARKRGQTDSTTQICTVTFQLTGTRRPRERFCSFNQET
jgi:hypothetical protein